MTRALQYELGITSLSDNFGPTTFAKLTAYGNVDEFSPNRNIRIIAEAALYCKGYSGGSLNGDFGASTVVGLTAVVSDMGVVLPTSYPVVTPKVFKALLNMDAFVLTSGGEPAIQTCQRWLNGYYGHRAQYNIGPCDGHFSRSMQIALVLAIQYELGMTDSQVTGSIGPGTKSGLQSAAARVGASNGSAAWIRLFQTAMACNGYYNEWGDRGGSWSDKLTGNVKVFQEFCKISQSGVGDYDTWMSLLVSTGNPDRKGLACDVMYPLNKTTIATVKSLGYEMVGRYLTGGTNKVLTHSEIALIFDNDMSIFPLYQEWGDAVEHFNYPEGFEAGIAAYEAAVKFGIPAGTVLYFSVDYDALDGEITSYVIPHFQGIVEGIKRSPIPYAVGVYGCRNVCIRLDKAGLTTRSFVSGMSTGYSGNLGFPLPDNWSFDQVKNYTVASGSGTLELDHNIVSGRDVGVSSVTRQRDPNDGWYTYLIWLEARAGQWREQGNLRYTNAELVGQYLRMLDAVTNNKVFGYIVNFHVSDVVFGAFDQGFLDFVKSYPGKPDLLPLRDPAYLWDLDAPHFGASFGAVMNDGFAPDRTIATMADFGSWGGDLLSVLGQCHQEDVGEAIAYSFAYDRIAATGSNTFFDRKDWISDVDAVVLGMRCRADGTLRMSDLFKQRYATPATARARYQEFIDVRFNGDREVMKKAAESMFDAIGGGQAKTIRDAFWYHDFGSITCPTPGWVSEGVRTRVAEAFADVAVRFARS
ncbi:glycoside hydrolase domain-containing protein [Actinoplanes sp. OR16]|uniref:glycoside hydrolase domain-containing protein n=1 Tax=Actinoplanes sp. OR16 TaxID=946334 RepID=UPI00135F1BC2|nr:glycoside hydrolase domain-containing protein [Actinoplanes sp. OR16]